MTAPAREEAELLLTRLSRALAAIAVLALLFTAVNVTLFAVSRGVPWPIALLLDPMVALALATVLYADARLTSWGIRPPAWSTTLRWFTGLAATLMNCWDSLWPDGDPGWPRHADPAAVFLHAVPPLLLILLTETVASYRRHLTPTGPEPDHCRTRTDPCAGTGHDRLSSPGTPPHLTTPAGPRTPPRSEPGGPPHAITGPAPADGHSGPSRPGLVADTSWDGNGPVTPTRESTASCGPNADPDADLLARATVLNSAAHALTGRPVSIRRLRTELGIGTDRARRIHHRLSTRQPTGTEPHPHPHPHPHPVHDPQSHPGAPPKDS
ncbi:extensin [Streptomyces sp. 4N509B]|uniref:extensin n=1 Tax=Streptomyces sp. 4N509B TaxID=3457413 RepID=UPI003FD4EB1C